MFVSAVWAISSREESEGYKWVLEMNNVTEPRREEPAATHLGRPVNQKVNFTLISVIRQPLIPPAHFKHPNTGQTSESWHHAAKPLSLYRVTGGPGPNSDPEILGICYSIRHRWEGESEVRSPWVGRRQICQNTGARKCESQLELKKYLIHWGESLLWNNSILQIQSGDSLKIHGVL